MNRTIDQLAKNSEIDSTDIERVVWANANLQEALCREDHAAIRFFDHQLKFWLALISAKLCSAALAAGDLRLAQTFHIWSAKRRVPIERQGELINSVLGL